MSTDVQTEESRPVVSEAAIQEIVSNDISMVPPTRTACQCGRPSWGEFVQATCEAEARGYDHGLAQGWHQRGEFEEANALQVEIARGVQDHADVHRARQAASEGPW